MRKLIWGLLCCFVISGLCFLGCDVQKPITPTTYTSIQGTFVIGYLKDLYQLEGGRVFCQDVDYTLLDKKWVKSQLVFGFNEFLQYNGVTEYKSEISDCDKYSRLFVDHATKRLRLESTSPSAPSIGVVSYVQQRLGKYEPHQINILLVRDENNQPSILFFEPQHKAFVTLTSIELSTITRIIF